MLKLIVSFAIILFFGFTGIMKLLEAKKMPPNEGEELAAYRKVKGRGMFNIFIAALFLFVQVMRYFFRDNI